MKQPYGKDGMRGSIEPTYLFDARSAGWPRITGWERYAREIASRIDKTDPLVRVRVSGGPRSISRAWQDAVATPAATRSVKVAHFPTIPPAPWARPRKRLVYTVHDLTWWRHPAMASRLGRHYYRRLARFAIERAHLVADTRAVADEFVQDFGVHPDDITVVPLGVGLPEPRPSHGPRGRPYLLAVGTLEPRKNLTRLADAYARSGVAKTHDLVIVGRVGWGDIPTGVRVLSGLDDQGLADSYHGATALLLPSLYEGFGLPVVEAMQMGVPVVCSDIPVLREVSGGYAYYVDPYDLDSLIEGVRAATTLAPQVGAGEWSRAMWSWDRTVSDLSALYRRLDS